MDLVQTKTRSFEQEKPETRRAKKSQVKILEQKVRMLEAELLDSRRMFQSIADNAPDVICRFNGNFEHLYVNPALEKATGIPVLNFIGKTPHSAGLPTPMADFWVNILKQVFEKKEYMTFDFSFPTPIGERHYQTLLVPEISNVSQVESILSWTRDITDMVTEQRQKDVIFGMVSHELKNPLTSLMAFTELLRRKFTTTDAISASYLSTMEKQINKLNRLVVDMLGITRARTGGLQFVVSTFNINDLIKEVVFEMQQTSPEHKIFFENTSEVLVSADRDRVSQVLINLISNSIKYSAPGSKILISLKKEKDQVLVGVKDEGRGIPKKMQPQVFERFFRINADTKNNPPGLGLGLYIAKEIVLRLGGRIWVESIEGKGAAFFFTLPLK